jgi:hypothetical protein
MGWFSFTWDQTGISIMDSLARLIINPAAVFDPASCIFFFKRPLSLPEQIEVGLIGLIAAMALAKPKSGRSF